MGLCAIKCYVNNWGHRTLTFRANMSELLSKIEAFLDKYAMEATAFGLEVRNDSHLVHDIRRGDRKLRRATVRDIEDFMRSYKDRNRK